MILERAELICREGQEDEFEAVLRGDGAALISGAAGAGRLTICRGHENPGKFMLLIEWDTLEAHMAWTKDATHQAFRDLVSPFSVGGSMEHFVTQ